MVDNSTSAGIVDAEDKISALPDFLIHHIMSFLKIKDVIETRKVSRRWRPLWRSTPVLDFTGWYTAHSVIDRFLTVYDGEKIQRFQASIFYEYDYIFESWVRFSVEHNVDELDIQFFKYGRWGIMELYKMPDHHFNYGGLRVLKLSNCDLNVHPPFCLPSLALLHLCSVGVTHLDTSGCPRLENLILEECKGNLDLYAPNQNLRYLMMKDSGEFHYGLTIYAPYIVSIEFAQHLRRYYRVKDLSSIKCAALDFYAMASSEFIPDNIESLVQLLEDLSHVNSLKLCQWSIEILAYREIKKKCSMLPFSATRLELTTNVSKVELEGIASLLRTCRFTENLIINISLDPLKLVCKTSLPLTEDHTFLPASFQRISDLFDADRSWESVELVLSASSHLVNITILRFLASDIRPLHSEPGPRVDIDELLEGWNEMKLARLLFNRCRALDKVRIAAVKMRQTAFGSELLQGLERKLLALPRSSQNASVSFSPNPGYYV